MVDISVTTFSSHTETHISDNHMTTFETQETEVMLSQRSQVDEDRMSVTDEKALETAEAVPASGKELESDAESIKDGRLASDDEAQGNDEKDLAFSEPESEPLEDEILASSSPPRREAEHESEQVVEGAKEGPAHASSEISEEDFHDASELPQADDSLSAAHNDDRASYVTADSQVSESRETEEIGSPPTSRLRRRGRHPARGQLVVRL
jgi:hypothetical protein